jgi:hypothetical protein
VLKTDARSFIKAQAAFIQAHAEDSALLEQAIS